MRVDFYQLSRDPAPAVVAMLAGKVLQGGKRLLVVAEGQERLEEISHALWEASPESFLANGMAGSEHDARQPVLLSGEIDPANGAQMVCLADGQWRDPGESFERVLYLFDDASIDAARRSWRELGESEANERHFWKQGPQGGWVEGP